MEQRIHWADFQRQLEDVIEAVQNHRLTHIVTPGGQPMVVVIDYGAAAHQAARSSVEADWFRAHYREIVNQYPNCWVAIHSEQVVAWYDQLVNRWVPVNPDHPVHLAQCLIEFAGGTRPL